VRGTPRLRGTVLFFVIASRSIAYTLPSAKEVRARLAKEEYATTWQEEEQGEPQTECIARPEVEREAAAAQREAF
jgi:hypothetical protein